MEKVWYDLLNQINDKAIEPKNSSRDSAKKKADEIIELLQRNKELIDGLPLWEPLFITIDTWVYNGQSYVNRDCDMLVSIISFSHESFRCVVWSQECDIYNHITTKKKVKISSFKYRQLLKWQVFNKEDAPFLVSHIFIDDMMKKALFDS